MTMIERRSLLAAAAPPLRLPVSPPHFWLPAPPIR